MSALRGLDARLRLARLFLRTDARRRQGDLGAFLTAALAGGVDVVQVRQDDLDESTGREVLEEVRRVALTSEAIVGVVGSAAWAGAVQADLLHLEAGDATSAGARATLHPYALLGRSTSRSGEVDDALTDARLDYFCVAPAVPGAAGLDLVRYASQVAPPFEHGSKPWFALGGITPATLGPVLEAGARRIGVGRALTEADDPGDVAARLSHSLAQAWRADPAAERYRFAAAAGRVDPR